MKKLLVRADFKAIVEFPSNKFKMISWLFELITNEEFL